MKKSNDRELAIKNAALKLFCEKGFHATSTRDICEEAGVSKGTLYWYWKSKEEIAFSLASDMLGRFLALFEEESDETMPVVERLERLSKRVSKHYYKEKQHLRLLWKFRADQNYIFSPAYVEKVESYNIRTRKALERIIAQGVRNGELRKVDPKQMAFMILGIAEGFELQWLENEKEFSMQKAMPMILDLLLPGLKK